MDSEWFVPGGFSFSTVLCCCYRPRFGVEPTHRENASSSFPPSDPQDVFQDHSGRLKLYTVQGPQHGSDAPFPSKGTLRACLSACELSAALPLHPRATVKCHCFNTGTVIPRTQFDNQDQVTDGQIQSGECQAKGYVLSHEDDEISSSNLERHNI